MTRPAYTRNIDGNQTEIVKELRKIPGLTVVLDMDDIIVGWRGRTVWFEIKNPKRTLTKDKKVIKGEIPKSQIKLLQTFTGEYYVVWSLADILHRLGIKNNPDLLCGHCWLKSADDDPRCVCEGEA